MRIFVYWCIIIVIVSGAALTFWGGIARSWKVFFIGICAFVIGLTASFVPIYEANPCIPAEPIAYNSTQTVFTTDKGNIIINGIYPDGRYMLDMDDDTVLVVWQAVEGEEVGLG